MKQEHLTAVMAVALALAPTVSRSSTLFEYSNFGLNKGGASDTAALVTRSEVNQWEGGTTISDTLIMPIPARWLIEHVWSVGGPGTHIFDSNSPLTFPGTSTALTQPTDIAFGLQWDKTIESGETFQVTTFTQAPDPASTSMLLGSALIGIGFLKRGLKKA